ncbi:MAG: holo-ACP synthase [Armatimonadota bacterium]|nr:holo-ACP synthase [Armatimonadota bacterium]MCX7777370.1 holo-ACP synthase [Armatimonadota bacterium]MDW8025362.1 holo-ACP synthase [Armatimonadota bacterium]
MPIVGIGIDAVEVERIRSMLERYGNRFINKIFQPEEATYCMSQHDPAQHFAARYAAREAFAKALGTGFVGISWRDISVVRDSGGVPRVCLYGAAAKVASKRGVKRVWLSLTHTNTLAIAVVVLEG